MLSKVLGLDYLSCPRIWNIEKEKDRGKEKGGDRPAKLCEEKSDRELEREKKLRRHFLLEEKHENFVAAVIKMRNACGNEGENERAVIKKKEQEQVRHFLQKTCKGLFTWRWGTPGR